MKNAELYKEIFFWVITVIGSLYLYFSETREIQKNQYLILFFVILVGMIVFLSVTTETLKLHNERTKQLNRIEKNQMLLMKALEKDIKKVKESK